MYQSMNAPSFFFFSNATFTNAAFFQGKKKKEDSPKMTSTENSYLFWSVSFAIIILIHGISISNMTTLLEK